MILSNITSPPDAEARLRAGVKVYANTDGDITEVWSTLQGTSRRVVPAGSYLGKVLSWWRNQNGGQLTWVGLDTGGYVPVTATAVEPTAVQPLPASEVERLTQLLQRERITAHRLLLIKASGRPLTAQQQAVFAQITRNLEQRKADIVQARWLATPVQAWDSGFEFALQSLGIRALPALAIPLGIAAVVGVIGLALWLSSRESQSVADLSASLDLYNQLRGQLPETEKAKFDQLISQVASKAAEAAKPSIGENIGQLAIGAVVVVLAVVFGPKLMKRNG
jgi:hypothetical protein